MSKVKLVAKVHSQKEIAKDIFDLVIETKEIANMAVAGQFVNLYTKDKSKLMPRPISICDVNKEKGLLRLVYRRGNETTGTYELSMLKEGQEVTVMGSLGKGFPVEKAENKLVYLVGGGIGIPPMLYTGKKINGKVKSFLGYGDFTFLIDDMKEVGEVNVATISGCEGYKGNCVDLLKQKEKPDLVFACGPKPMLKALVDYCNDNNIECYVSLEEKMACGIGACLGCVCKSKDVDHHSNVKNKRVCCDGPVFSSKEVEL